jgi:hypothetical protein
MTRQEIKLVLKQLEEHNPYSVRLFLDNQTTVLAHEWSLEEEKPEGDAAPEDGQAGEGRQALVESEALLRVATKGRQALIAVSRIVLIEMVPFRDR